VLGLSLWLPACGQAPPEVREPRQQAMVRVGAEILLGDSFSVVSGKRIAVVANQTSRVGTRHLVDTLLARGVKIARVFAPEHGFRGGQEAGEHVTSGVDAQTKLPVVSLFGARQRPTAAEMAGIDLVVLDIQDVGARFYTYLSTLVYLMEACAESGTTLVVLDRPNPNGDRVGGPVLDTLTQRSFVGVHPIPILHGLTLGEYARLTNGERWLRRGKPCQLRVVPCRGYRHSMRWEATGLPWVPPSPNLRTPLAARLYPILCWYEGTPVSVGRGTDAPFQQMGAPWAASLRIPTAQVAAITSRDKSLAGAPNLTRFAWQAITFTPRSISGQALHPPFEGLLCQGARADQDAASTDELFSEGIEMLKSFYEAHRQVDKKGKFFVPFFDRLVGSDALRQQIIAGMSTKDILKSWEPGVAAFHRKSARYRLYPD
jgi:uncharacterized protein YbbC (DUF1343 family)